MEHLGITKMKQDAKRHMVKVALYMIVISDGKIVLMKRQNSGCDDQMFTVPGGHMEKNETPLGGAIRETLEEIDIKVKMPILSSVIYRTNLTVGQKCSRKDFIDFFFKCESHEGVVKIMELDKCSEIIFANVNDLPDNMVPQVEFAIKNMLGENLKYLTMER